MNQKSLYRIVCACLAIALSACGGGGGAGASPSPGATSFDTALEAYRIGGITKVTLDVASIFYPITEGYLMARAGNVIACPTSGTIGVTSPASGQYSMSFSSCNNSWTTITGTVSFVKNNADLVANAIDLTWDGLRYQGALVLTGAAGSSPSGLHISADNPGSNTITKSGTSYGWGANMDIYDSSGTYRFAPATALVQPLGPGTMWLDIGFDAADLPAHVNVAAIDVGGTFKRVLPPYDGDLDFSRANYSQMYFGDIQNSGSNFDAVFTDLNNVNQGSVTAPWANVLATPYYDPYY